MTQNFRVVRPEPPPDDQQRAAEALPKRRIAENAANSGRIAGNAKWIVARRSSWGYPPRRCIWCNQPIEPGTLYVQQDRWLVWRGRSFPAGPRHDRCWGLENEHA